MPPLQDIPSYLVSIAFNPDATALELFFVAIAFGVFWYIVFKLATPVLRNLSYDTPWLRGACEREWNRNREGWPEKVTKEEALESMMKDWAPWQVINIQHLAGAALCIPSLLGVGDPSWASSLAACGVLSEMGYELQHFVVDLLYVRFFTASGAKEVSNGTLVVMAFHHCLASGLGLPMVLHYRTLKAVHWLCFELQFGAAAGILTEYSKMLDISKPNDLRKFKVVNFLLFALMAWTRLLHWVYLCIQIFMVWYQEKAWTFIAVGILPICAFSVFNAMFCVIPFYKRFMKFLHKSVEYESISPSEPDEKRQKSMANLEDAVAELLIEESNNINPQDALENWALTFLESTEGEAKLDRRQTMPPRRMMSLNSVKMMRGMSAPDNSLKMD